ncbi:peptidase family M48-domain-containing protein [Mrakia frigida]|uniref:M48 family metallopeptidase n=1 Tax=Mrakia frigida TaxID=29902 RepID=UPI003FCBF535
MRRLPAHSAQLSSLLVSLFLISPQTSMMLSSTTLSSLHRSLSLGRTTTATLRTLSKPPSRSLLLRASPSRSSSLVLPPFRILSLSTRNFHSSPPRRDVFFLTVPALKSGLLTITRVTLLMLPFVWRWKLWRKYRKASLLLVQIPIFALCLIFALGLDQSPNTQRWRLLLMSESEEMAWSRRRAETQLSTDLPLLLPPTSPQSIQTLRVATRLVEAIDAATTSQSKPILSFARFMSGGVARDPLDEEMVDFEAFVGGEDEWGPGAWGEAKWLRERSSNLAAKAELKRSGGGGQQRSRGAAYSDGKLKGEEEEKLANVVMVGDWKIYVVDLPKINAFALPSKELFVFSGLVDLVEHDELLAAVLAHEMAHVTQRHAVENLGFLNVATVLFDVIRGISYALTLSFPLVTDGAALAINYLNDVVTHRAYSRKLEMEADEVGLEFMARAGYNPRAAHALWELMDCVESDAAAAGQPISLGERFEFLQTHPNNAQRQKHIERLLPRATEIWREARKAGSSTTTTTTTAGRVGERGGVEIPEAVEKVPMVVDREDRVVKRDEEVVVVAVAARARLFGVLSAGHHWSLERPAPLQPHLLPKQRRRAQSYSSYGRSLPCLGRHEPNYLRVLRRPSSWNQRNLFSRSRREHLWLHERGSEDVPGLQSKQVDPTLRCQFGHPHQ